MAPKPPPPPPLTALLTFCEFLECRVHTKGLPLFRRMLRDFWAGNEHTLLDFMRLGVQAVAVLPRGLRDRNRRVVAAHLLQKQREQRGEGATAPMVSTDTDRVFRYLLARVATKNITWLRAMFEQFCAGSEELLREFLRRGDQGISVLPVDLKLIQQTTPPSTPLLLPPPPPMVSPSPSPSPLTSPGRKRARGPSQSVPSAKRKSSTPKSHKASKKRKTGGSNSIATVLRDEKSVEQEAGADEGENRALPCVTRPWRTDKAQHDLHVRLADAFRHEEAREPWLRIFHDELRLPFSASRHPELAAKLRLFWATHGRAVWEREFWAPLSRLRRMGLDQGEQNRRKRRQEKAQHFFETSVIAHVHVKLGADFFFKLDARASRFSGWWYRRPVVDLFTMAGRKGERSTLTYLSSQTEQRFPRSNGAGVRYNPHHNNESESMWSSSSQLQPLLHEILALRVS